ncbi:MAG: type IV pilus assembly protein PilV [Pseudohongiellaceae bacterium]|jgi:type IV pilus assembly protein PilV
MLKDTKGMTYSRLKRSVGTSLVEIIVAVLILAVGLLGLAATHINGIKISQETALRFQANVLAADMIERMRANMGTANTAVLYNMADSSVYVPGAQDCEALPCELNDLASWDKAQWKAAIDGSMPSGIGSVAAVVAAGTKTYTVTVSYLGATGNREQVIVQTVL